MPQQAEYTSMLDVVERMQQIARNYHVIYEGGYEEGKRARSPTRREHELAKCLAAVDGELWAGVENTLEWAALRNHVMRARALIHEAMPNLREERENAGD